MYLPDGMSVDFGAVMQRMRRLRAQISYHDSARRFKELGVDVFIGRGQFTGPDTLAVDGTELRFKRACIATGTRPAMPRIDGLAEAGFLTNENVFSLTERPATLAVIGGGPVGTELAQALRRLGSQVMIFHTGPHLLSHDEEDAAVVVQNAMERDGVELYLECNVTSVESRAGQKVLAYKMMGKEGQAAVSEILVATGRMPNTEGIGLEAAGIEFDRLGVRVNDKLQTTNPRVYAAGDVALDAKFTHMADFAARIVVQNALFKGRRKLSALEVPWCTFTDPEVAHVGLTEKRAAARGVKVRTFVRELRDVDRAVLDGDDEGFVKIHVKKGTDRIVGATIVARDAGNMISELTVAITAGVGLKKLANVIHPYPTQAEAIRQVGDLYNKGRLGWGAKKFLKAMLAAVR
jgi:pyruvate/2-oxoglutarate dehydrogenase complex dihydrolipoamide dehydrogenase (E3) component